MINDFLKYQAQTSPHPMGLEISHAKGSYIYDTTGKAYLDFIAGVSANTLGHQPKAVVEAVKQQVDQYMHVMVYGEFVQQPQVALTKFLADKLPDNLNCTYLTNSGTEATEGALKLAKKATGRSEIIAAKHAYHGNTQGAMSVCGTEIQNRPFRPLIPGTQFIEFNNLYDLDRITTQTAAVILETIQGGAGIILPNPDYLNQVKKKCEEVGALLILDEIQTGIGRTGTLFGFEQFNVIPDIIITGKGLGGGMPIGAFIGSKALMDQFKDKPKLGHITTFGGHPVIATAALATLKSVYQENLMPEIQQKEALIRDTLKHPLITEIRGKGLLLAAMVKDSDIANFVILKGLEEGLLLFWLLFEPKAIRITPPLNMSDADLLKGCAILLNILDQYR